MSNKLEPEGKYYSNYIFFFSSKIPLIGHNFLLSLPDKNKVLTRYRKSTKKYSHNCSLLKTFRTGIYSNVKHKKKLLLRENKHVWLETA